MLSVIKWKVEDGPSPGYFRSGHSCAGPGTAFFPCRCSEAVFSWRLHYSFYYDCLGHTKRQPGFSASAFNPRRFFHRRLRHGGLGAVGAVREGAFGDSRRSTRHLVVMPRGGVDHRHATCRHPDLTPGLPPGIDTVRTGPMGDPAVARTSFVGILAGAGVVLFWRGHRFPRLRHEYPGHHPGAGQWTHHDVRVSWTL